MKTHSISRILASCVGVAALVSSLGTRAGQVTYNFDTDPSGILDLYGNCQWYPAGGNPAGGGYLSITDAIGSQGGLIVFEDIDNGALVKSFSFECDVRVGNAVGNDGRPADGFSISYVRENDPLLTTVPPTTGQFAAGLAEAGSTTGIAVGFDVWSGNTLPDTTDIEGIIVRVDNVTVLKYPMPTRNGTVTDTTSIQTGPYNADSSGDPSILSWAKLRVDLTEDGKLTVNYKGSNLLENFQTTFYPSPGQLVLGGRTGGANQNQHVDNIKITTTTAAGVDVSGFRGTIPGFEVDFLDLPPSSVLDQASVVCKLDGAVVPTTFTKVGNKTTAVHYKMPPYASGSPHVLVVDFKDTAGRTFSKTLNITTPVYGSLLAVDKNTGVNTSAPGFRVWPHQVSGGQPNTLQWTEEQLAGLRGANLAITNTAAADGSYNRDSIDFAQEPGSEGRISPSGAFSEIGIPGNAPDGSPLADAANSAMEVTTYLEFPAQGVYRMNVASDDGFRVQGGRTPRGPFGVTLGQFDAGRGVDAGTTFDFYVEAQGIYPIRLIWENGAGGAGIEWTSVLNGTNYVLVGTPGDPIKAYRSSSLVYPYANRVYPPVNGQNVLPGFDVFVEFVDTAITVNDASISLALNGTPLQTTLVNQGPVTKVTGTVATPVEPGSTNTVTLVYDESSGGRVTKTWTFVTVAGTVTYPTLPIELGSPVGSGVAGKNGFRVKTWQLPDDRSNDMANNLEWSDALLTGVFRQNVADLSAFTDSGAYPETTTVNYAKVQNESNGNFVPDRGHPGIVADGSGVADNYTSEFVTYVEFPVAGHYTMGVNSDDNFRVTATSAPTRQYLQIEAPAAVQGPMPAVASAIGLNANLGGPLPTTPIVADVVFVGGACTASGGISQDLTGKIALIERGGCTFVEKSQNAQAKGAVAVIIGNQQANEGFYPIVMGGDGFNVTIPVMMVDYADSQRLIANATGLRASIGRDPAVLLGEFNGNGRGASDTLFTFVVPAAGVYPLRCTYMQGGGGANVEWFAINRIGEKVLLNDPNNPSALKVWRERTASPITPPSITGATVANGKITITWTGGGKLQSAPALPATNWSDAGTGGSVTEDIGAGNKFYRVVR